MSVLGQGFQNVFIAIGVLGWATFARLVRGQILSVKSMEYVEAARAQGAGDLRIIFRHVLPNSMAPVYVAVAMAIGGAIATEAALSYLGIGVQPPNSSWGTHDRRRPSSYLAVGQLVVAAVPQPRPGRPRCSASSRSATACATPPTPSSRNRHGRTSPRRSRTSRRTSSPTPAWSRRSTASASRSTATRRIGIVGESGSGKTVAALSLMRPHPRPARARWSRARSCWATATCAPSSDDEMRGGARQRHRHDLPGPDDQPESGHEGRQADRRGHHACIRTSRRARRWRMADRSSSPASASPTPDKRVEPVPVRVLRRHAPARHDRHGRSAATPTS